MILNCIFKEIKLVLEVSPHETYSFDANLLLVVLASTHDFLVNAILGLTTKLLV